MQKEITTIINTKKRYEVIVHEKVGEAEQCGVCDRYFEWSGVRLHSFECPICGRKCCMDCSAEHGLPQFPERYVCDECEELPIEKQLLIAKLTAELNQ